MREEDLPGFKRQVAKQGPKTYIDANVEMRGVKFQTLYMMQEMGKVFNERGLNCHFTSVVRVNDKDSYHGYGFAVDGDADIPIAHAVFEEMKEDLKGRVGPQYDVVFHRGHLHGEFDPWGGLEIYLRRREDENEEDG